MYELEWKIYGIIGPHAKTSRISSFELGGVTHSEKAAFQPSAETNKKKNTSDLTRRDNSNVLARGPIIPVFTVHEGETQQTSPAFETKKNKRDIHGVLLGGAASTS